MQIERDQVEFFSGVRHGFTLGSPVTLQIRNRDWSNWEEVMSISPADADGVGEITNPRPGHADLAGALKYRHRDIRNVLERASARETASRVAVGAVAAKLLAHFDITSYAHVTALGGVRAKVDGQRLNDAMYQTPLYCTDPEATDKMLAAINTAREQGDSLGGIIEVVVNNLPPGLGSHVHWDRKLDGRIAQAVMSVQAIKGVEVGLGFEAAELPGSAVHDEIAYNVKEHRFTHKGNNCGGIEGGISNGNSIVIRAAMKPIPTLGKPLMSVDLASKEGFVAAVERADTCAVAAAAIVCQAAVVWEIAGAFMEKFSGDHMEEVSTNYANYCSYLRDV
jgi:chorismate synthase